MRKTLLMAGALLAMTATFASAAGLELAWNQCFGQAGAVATRTSSCNANTGQQSLFASFRPPAGITKLEGLEAFIDYQVQNGLACWWDMSVANPIRSNALTTLHVSPTDVNGAPLIACDNHYFLDNNAGGGGGAIVLAPDRGQLKGLVAIGAGLGLPVPADAQQYGMGFRITNAFSIECAGGCLSPACLVLNTINLTSFGVPNVVLQSPHPGSENWITWQASASSIGCPGISPARKETWGSVKALYR